MVPPCGFKSHYLHHVAADFICSQRLFYAPHQKSLLTHSVAAPLQTESASLGFGLGSFHGSLFPSTLTAPSLLPAVFIGIHIDPELHYKLHYIADYEGRSANGQILYLIRQCIREFERKEGVIPYENPDDKKDAT